MRTLPFRVGVFFAVFCFGFIPARTVFAHLQLSRLWYWRTNASNRCRLRIPLFDSSLCDGLLPHVHNHPFVQLIHIRRFTRLHSLCWLTPATFIPPSFRLSMCSMSSACPTVFGYAETFFSAFGLSELCSAMPKLSFRPSACPSFSVICWQRYLRLP